MPDVRHESGVLALSEQELRLVLDILREQVSGTRVFAFGSRVRGTAKRFSDLDLVVQSDSELGLERLGALRSMFSESDLPIAVDVVEWSNLAPTFQRLIEPEMVRIYP